MTHQHGGFELRRNLNSLADRGALKGWYAQLKWLTATQPRRDATVAALAPTSRDPVRLIRTWLASDPDVAGSYRIARNGRRGQRELRYVPYSPSKANVARIQALYTSQHRRSRARAIAKRLDNGGQGVIIEIWASPEVIAQSRPTEGRRGSGRHIPEVEHIPWRRWGTIIAHWLTEQDGDAIPGLRADWEDIADNLYPPGAWYYIDRAEFP